MQYRRHRQRHHGRRRDRQGEAELDRVIGINLKGVFFGCQAALRHMVPRGQGNIVNVSSSGIDTPYPGLAVYGMTKSAVAFLSMTLAAEVGPLGVRVNIACSTNAASSIRRRRSSGMNSWPRARLSA